MSESEKPGGLNAALAAAQAEFPQIERNRTVTVKTQAGGEYTFSYADLGTILAAVRPVLAAHGLALVQRFEDVAGRVTLRTELRHKEGGTMGGSFPLTRIPDSPQQLGSLITYLRRYSIVSLLAIAAEDDDDAGQASTFQAPKLKSEDGGSYAEQREERTLTEPQRKAIMAIRSKLIKANLLSEEGFDSQLADDYGATVSGLTRSQASDLIDRLKQAEARLQGPLVAAEQGTAEEDIPF
jgi:ERF superfamily